MSKFLKCVLTTFIISILIIESILYGVIVQKKDVFDSSYQSLIVDKYRALENTNDKKIIMVAGSSSAFGLDQEMLEEETGYKVVNLGLHAGFGQLFPSELAKENINPGDIVLLGYEYNWYLNFDALNQQLIMSGIDDNIDMYKHIPIERWNEFLGYLFKYGSQKNTYKDATGTYSRESFSSDNGQMTLLRATAMYNYFEDIDTYGDITVLDKTGEIILSEYCIKYLKDLKEYVEDCGASIYFVSPPCLYESISCSVDDIEKLAELEEEIIGIPYISDPKLYMFPNDLMCNSIYHCNSEGEKIRTSILIDDLKLCGAIESELLTSISNCAIGETFVLVDELPKRFLHKPFQIERVYMIDCDGNETHFIEGVDYVVDYERGTIRRTEASAIPNYIKHSVSYTKGKFSLISNSEIVNPESNRSFQVRIDYDYYVSENELQSIENNGFYLSPEVRDKINNGDDISILLIGDSIGAGTDTNGNEIFVNYIDKSLESYYGINVNTTNMSIDGGTRDLLNINLQTIIDISPDIVMIEFGMNDHCGANANIEESVDSYKNDIEYAVQTMKDNCIDVILLGFFQQNMTWDAENFEATRLYNNALYDIAETNDVYFADVYSVFERVGYIKPLSRDVMSDYIHNPNEWGHKLYYTSIIEVFNINGDMRPIDLPNYVYI